MGGGSELCQAFCSKQLPDRLIKVRPCMLATFMPGPAPYIPAHLSYGWNVRCTQNVKVRGQGLFLQVLSRLQCILQEHWCFHGRAP